MRRQFIETLADRRGRRVPGAIEFYNYPSPLARQCWCYVLAIGQAKVADGEHFKPDPGHGFLLHYIRRGTHWHNVRRQPCEARAGTVCFMDFGESVEHANPGPEPVDLWWLLFDGRDVPHLFTELRCDRRPLFESLNTSRVESVFKDLVGLTRNRPAAYEARSSALLGMMLAELFTARADQEHQVDLVGHEAVLSAPVRRGMDFITRSHARRDLGLLELGDVAGISPRHFARLFRSEVGITPIQYLIRYRIERAKQLLASTEKTIEQVADLVGVYNQSYFAYVFRKMTGKSPRDYRAKARRQKVGAVPGGD